MPHLVFLSANNCGVKSLHGLERSFGLRNLFVSQNSISHFLPIQNCHELEVIDATCNPLRCFVGLHQLRHLQELFVDDFAVSSQELSFFLGFANLTFFKVNGWVLSESNGLKRFARAFQQNDATFSNEKLEKSLEFDVFIFNERLNSRKRRKSEQKELKKGVAHCKIIRQFLRQRRVEEEGRIERLLQRVQREDM